MSFMVFYIALQAVVFTGVLVAYIKRMPDATFSLIFAAVALILATLAVVFGSGMLYMVAGGIYYGTAIMYMGMYVMYRRNIILQADAGRVD